MLLATTRDGRRLLPSRDEAGFYPECGLPAIPRMGSQRLHHWAHVPGSEYAYGRGMTEWHERWLLRHHNPEGWQIVHRYGNYR
jgi:competence protein CoiA